MNVEVADFGSLGRQLAALKPSQTVARVMLLFEAVATNKQLQKRLSSSEATVGGAVLTEQEVSEVTDFYLNHMAVGSTSGDDVISASKSVCDKLHSLCRGDAEQISSYSYASLLVAYEKLNGCDYFCASQVKSDGGGDAAAAKADVLEAGCSKKAVRPRRRAVKRTLCDSSEDELDSNDGHAVAPESWRELRWRLRNTHEAPQTVQLQYQLLFGEESHHWPV